MYVVSTQDTIPNFAYGILGLSITLATFLPSLIYSYNKGLLQNIITPKLEKNEKVWQNIVSFIFTNDLLVTQSMIQVGFSTVYGLLIYSSNIIVFSNGYYNIWFFLFVSLVFNAWHWSAYFSSKKAIKDHADRVLVNKLKYVNIYWKDYKQTKKIWNIFSVTNLVIITSCILISLSFPLNQCCLFIPLIKIFFICYLSLILVLYSISWLIPIVLYNPLTREIEDYLYIYEAQKKKAQKKKAQKKKALNILKETSLIE